MKSNHLFPCQGCKNNRADGFRLDHRLPERWVALSKFYYWLENRLSQQPIIELKAAEQLTVRSQDKEYVSDMVFCLYFLYKVLMQPAL